MRTVRRDEMIVELTEDELMRLLCPESKDFDKFVDGGTLIGWLGAFMALSLAIAATFAIVAVFRVGP